MRNRNGRFIKTRNFNNTQISDLMEKFWYFINLLIMLISFIPWMLLIYFILMQLDVYNHTQNFLNEIFCKCKCEASRQKHNGGI